MTHESPLEPIRTGAHPEPVNPSRGALSSAEGEGGGADCSKAKLMSHLGGAPNERMDELEQRRLRGVAGDARRRLLLLNVDCHLRLQGDTHATNEDIVCCIKTVCQVWGNKIPRAMLLACNKQATKRKYEVFGWLITIGFALQNILKN